MQAPTRLVPRCASPHAAGKDQPWPRIGAACRISRQTEGGNRQDRLPHTRGIFTSRKHPADTTLAASAAVREYSGAGPAHRAYFCAVLVQCALLRRIGVRLEGDGDQPLIKSVDNTIEKAVTSVINAAIKEAQAEGV